MDIFASKLFKTSTRQDKIRAAAQNPVNAELVKQLSEYVDPEDKHYLKPSSESDEKIDFGEPDAEFESSDENKSESSSPDFSSAKGPERSTGANGKFDMPEGAEEDLPDMSEGPDVAPDEKPADDEISEATDIVDDEDSDPVQYISDNIEDIKSLLNEDVARVQIKNNSSELWIYYKDKINLNSIMEDEIAALSDSKYSNLEFNRLARTENAIVFSIEE